MSATGFSDYIQKSGRHHPFLKGLVALFIAITLLLGLLHEGLIVGEVSIVFVQQFKREAGEIAEVGRRLKKELTTWDNPTSDKNVPTVKPPESAGSAVHATAAPKSH